MTRRLRTPDDRRFDLMVNIFLLTVLAVTLIPLLYVVTVSVTPLGRSASLLLPAWDWSFNAYAELLKQPAILRAGLNSVLITVSGVLISMILTVCTAYPLSRPDLPGRKFLTGVILFTFLFNAGLIPLYLVVRDLHLLNTYWALLLHGAVSVYNLFVMKNFFQNLPDSLEEAAKIDGASELQVLWHIVLPLSRPILLTIGLFYAVTQWNSFFEPILFLSNRDMMPLPVVLRDILTGLNSADYVESAATTTAPPEGLKMAAVVLTTIPMLLIYPWIQRYFTSGTLSGGVKE
ncbi:carbohydrate ABC transporter permease [Deinococcus knuensis]|uniref:ABC transporter permease protein YtcP n=1 Tax=Deinococcus knuensis TaxID=1837380 RepID=A0ABQ2T240_9DEIO|nr:carbohydrate ABC transporter permease [Deinococcus knuensis]GGS44020.1 putative ABC transporter permease protein YtcP [Deinococcus knuensis]